MWSIPGRSAGGLSENVSIRGLPCADNVSQRSTRHRVRIADEVRYTGSVAGRTSSLRSRALRLARVWQSSPDSPRKAITHRPDNSPRHHLKSGFDADGTAIAVGVLQFKRKLEMVDSTAI